jgi:NAD(P)-dependent dehydrogenase (short-subunit alcohol dehydrogenase family)
MTKMAAGLIKSLGEEKMAAAAPLGRLGDDEDLKGITLLYASDAGKHITGQWLAVDGGVSVVLAPRLTFCALWTLLFRASPTPTV